jgi:hypothetical protein
MPLPGPPGVAGAWALKEGNFINLSSCTCRVNFAFAAALVARRVDVRLRMLGSAAIVVPFGD